MLYRSRISRSRFTGSKSFGASIMFFTSGRPTRSILTLNVPRVRVSATTPTRSPPGQEAGVDLDDDAEHVLAVEEDRAGIGESELPGRDRRQGGAGIHDERVPARAGEDPHAVPSASLPIVDAEGDRFPDGPRRCPAADGSAAPRRCPERASGASKTQSRTISSSPGTNPHPASFGLGWWRGRSRKRYSRPSEKKSEGLAIGRVFRTSTSQPGRSGLGNAYTSVMSAIGSARARGPEMWSDMTVARLCCG